MGNDIIDINRENISIMYFEANSFMNAYVLKKEQLKAALGKISHEIDVLY